MNDKKKVETAPVNEEKTAEETAKSEELTLGDKAKDPVEKEPYSFKNVPANEDAVIKEEEEPPVEMGLPSEEPELGEWAERVKEAALVPANVVLILRSETDVVRAKKLYQKYRPVKHSGNLSAVRVNERQEPRVLWRHA